MQTSPIRRYILDNLSQHQKDIIKAAIRKFGLSRQAVLRHMKALILDGKVEAYGKTRDRYYVLKPLVDHRVDIDITPGLEEDTLGRRHIYPHLVELPRNIVEICEYGFSQMMNNVIAHSQGKRCRLRLKITARDVSLRIRDDGVGVFRKIGDHLGLGSPHRVILELSKGKLTTDPDHHTGEGIFFTLRLFDSVTIASDTLQVKHDLDGNKWRTRQGDPIQGTAIKLSISAPSERTLRDVFRRYSTDGGEDRFNRTEVPVTLASFNSESLMSRSQARRVLQRMEIFDEVCLDFKDVESIGQPFADEIFRVYQDGNKKVQLSWMNASPDIDRMISRVKNHPT